MLVPHRFIYIESKPETNIAGCAERSEAHHFAIDALRYAQHILQKFHAIVILFPCDSAYPLSSVG